jgi:cytoskeleton protein RodZ
MSNSDNDNNNKFDFGSLLSGSRKAQKYSIDDVSRHLKIPAPIIEAIEANDIAALPPPTFAKGYLRAYARYLEISEEKVLEQYNRAVPQNTVAKLKSRSNLPSEKNSQTPIIKSVTIVLVIAVIAAVIYGIFGYYQEKADVIENQLETKKPDFTASSLDSPVSEEVTIEQNAELTDDDELILRTTESDELVPEDDSPQTEAATDETTVEPAAAAGVQTAPAINADNEPTQDEPVAEEPRDTIQIFAEKGAWMEIRDATDKRLYYNMLREGGSTTLHGVAPFYVSLGNARTTKVTVNGLDVDMTDFIGAKNTARFTVSTDRQSVVFH